MRTFNNYLRKIGISDAEVATLKNSESEIQSQLNLKTANAISKTYAELAIMISNGTLVPGQHYLLTDYASVHTIPGTVDTNTPTAEPIIVLAIAANKLAPEAYSPSFPQDVIYYSPSNDQAIVPGCTKGFIYKRVDTQNSIDIGFDWRNVKFRRWQISVTAEDATGAVGNYTKGAVIKKTGTVEIYIKLNDATAQLFTNISAWKRFEWDDLQYVSPVASAWYILDSAYQVLIPCSALYMDYTMFCTAPTVDGVQSSYSSIFIIKIAQNNSNILTNCNSIFFGNNITNNTIESGFYSNTIGNIFTGNTIGSGFYSNTIGNSFSSNTIGNSFSSNTIGNSFSSNTIGNSFSSNTIGFSFSSNTIGNSFSSNTIGNGFYSNSIGDNSSSNIIGNSFSSNTIGDSFSSNTIGDSFSSNIIGNSFSSNTLIHGFFSNTIGNSFSNNTILYNFSNNTIENSFRFNTIGNNFKFNTIGADFSSLNLSSATLVYAAYPKWWFKTPDGTKKLYYFANTSFALTVADVTA